MKEGYRQNRTRRELSGLVKEFYKIYGKEPTENEFDQFLKSPPVNFSFGRRKRDSLDVFGIYVRRLRERRLLSK